MGVLCQGFYKNCRDHFDFKFWINVWKSLNAKWTGFWSSSGKKVWLTLMLLCFLVLPQRCFAFWDNCLVFGFSPQAFFINLELKKSLFSGLIQTVLFSFFYHVCNVFRLFSTICMDVLFFVIYSLCMCDSRVPCTPGCRAISLTVPSVSLLWQNEITGRCLMGVYCRLSEDGVTENFKLT